MLWTTLVVIGSNLSIFILAPIYMAMLERDYSADHREAMLATKLLL